MRFALAFLLLSVTLSADTLTTIDYPGATSTDLTGINSSGDMVGVAIVAGQRKAFLYSEGQFTDLVYPDAPRTEATAIDSRGDIAGFYQDSSGQFYGFVLDKHGTFASYDYPPATTGTFILGLKSSRVLVGEFKIGQAFGVTGYALLRTKHGEWVELIPPDSTNARANSINSRGDIVGLMTGVDRVQRGWLLDKHDTYTVFAWPGAQVTNPRGINASGNVVGVYIVAGVSHAFIRTKDGEMRELVGPPGSANMRALAINAEGDIVGTYDQGGIRHGFLLERD